MLRIKTLSLTQVVNDWLASSHRPRVLHVFDNACNLINEEKEVLSLVIPSLGNGPFNLVVKDDIVFSGQIGLESPISNSPDRLHFGDMTISTDGATLWNSRPDWKILYAKRSEIFTRLTSTSPVDIRPAIPASQVSELPTSIVFADNLASANAARKLAGLGPGLTPAGDDFMMGALYAMWIIHPPEVAEELAAEIVKTAPPLTTSLSGAWIRSAGRGEAGQLWHELFDALMDGDEAKIQLRLENILAVGETSGADALAGFLNTVQAYMASFSRNAATSSTE